MTDATVWSAHDAGGAASTLLQISSQSTKLPDGVSSGMRIQLQSQSHAQGHYAERDLPAATDLTAFDELRLWLKSPRSADGSAALPFFLRVRLASATAGFAMAANTWERFLPVGQANYWQLVRMSLADLPAAVRSAVNAVRIELLDQQPVACNFDSLLAVSERLLADIESALLGALDKQFSLGGTPVPATLYLPPANLPATPNIRLSPAMIEYAPDLSVPLESRSDFQTTGYALRPPSRGYQVYYDIEADGNVATDRAALLDFVLDRLFATSLLSVNGEYLPMDLVPVPISPIAPPVRLPLRIRVRTWKASALPIIPVRPVKELSLQTEGAAR